MRKSTIKDVAARAQVSLKTVSRVINDETGVHERTRERVRKAIAELKQHYDFQWVFLLLMVPCYVYILYFAWRSQRAEAPVAREAAGAAPASATSIERPAGSNG